MKKIFAHHMMLIDCTNVLWSKINSCERLCVQMLSESINIHYHGYNYNFMSVKAFVIEK